VLRALEGRGGGAGRRGGAGQRCGRRGQGVRRTLRVEDGPDRWAPPVSRAWVSGLAECKRAAWERWAGNRIGLRG
jgi:hypothetical protein